MKLKEIAAFSKILSPEIADITITGVTSDSRKVQPGFLFAALKGVKADGGRFVADAVARGAVAVITDVNYSEPLSVAQLKSADPRLSLSQAAAAFYQRQPDVMVAVTGTSGKTSVASFTRQIWEYAGFAAANIGTTGVFSPTRSDYNSLTTPDPVELHRVLAELADEGVTHAAMEASSHGLDQRRLDGVKLAAAAFINLGRDHMDYHATIEEYLAAKMRLFAELLAKDAPAIFYADDIYSEQAIAIARQAGCLNIKTIGRKGDFIKLKRLEHERFRQHIEVAIGDEIFEVSLPLAGEFQVTNALIAAALAIETGVPPQAAMKALERLKGAPGRLDLVGSTENGALAYVDYAHKPDALENVLASVRPFTTGRIIVVFGCGGDRDKGKRPIMGEIATRLADVVIVTDDNPRSEVPEMIRQEIMAAAPHAQEIGDRKKAIQTAVAMMNTGDTLIVAGKGHEEGQTVGDQVLPFSDHAEIALALQARQKEV